MAGAVAVAVAAAWASDQSRAGSLLELAWKHTPEGKVRDGLALALEISADRASEEAAKILGNGSEVTAADTVPFSLWCAARHPDDYQEALWATVSALGDRDTTCAIVGGIVALSAPSIPAGWLAAREQLPVDNRG